VIYTDTLPDNGMGDAVRNSKYGNSTTRLPREKIIAELKDLDQDFQKTNPDQGNVMDEYKPVAGNAKIHFVLQEIIYVKSDPAAIRRWDNSTRLHQISPPKYKDSCLNVYISVLRVGGHGSEGVTNVPWPGLDTADDVNLNYSWVGLHYRLLSHEVGHWLGLWHMNDKRQLTLDQIDDIPVQNELTDINCVLCANQGVRVINSQRARFTAPNTNNFMDYSGCRCMFSIAQCSYMRGVVLRLRPVIWNNSPANQH